MNTPKTLYIEGWRGIPHSYAIVNQFQCLQFLLQPRLTLRHIDVPFAVPNWKPVTGLFSPAVEAAIAKISLPPFDEVPDVIYRIAYPYDIRPSASKRTFVFGTSEFCCVPPRYITGNRTLVDACNSCDAVIITPSNWSREGFIASGAPPERVKVIPHGVDTSVFHPVPPAIKTALRRQLKWDGFIFLSLGAMTGSKGMLTLLKAFAVVAQFHPQVRLMLKGIRSLYPSQAMIAQVIKQLTEMERTLIQPRLIYLENTLKFSEMAQLYQSADAYVSPYAAEGFNMPVLEAIACGLPVICTRGGSTDDFTTDEFALRINARTESIPNGELAGGKILNVDINHLIHLMITAVNSTTLAALVRSKGPALVANSLTWPLVTKRLLQVLFDDGSD